MFRILRPVDLACILLVTMAASNGVATWLGLSDTLSIIALTMGLACPAARRLIAWRRGVEPIRFDGGRASTILILCAMLPWLIVPALRTMPWQSIAGLATARVELPLAIRWAGVVLTMIGVLRPMMETLRGTGRIRSTAYIETVGLFVATGNVFLATLAAGWLISEARKGGSALLDRPATIALTTA
jgi:hypothetical protein